MTRAELERLCRTTLEQGLERVRLVIPGPPPRGERVRLAKRSGPLGDVLNWTETHGTVASFRAAAVLRWLGAK